MCVPRPFVNTNPSLHYCPQGRGVCRTCLSRKAWYRCFVPVRWRALRREMELASGPVFSESRSNTWGLSAIFRLSLNESQDMAVTLRYLPYVPNRRFRSVVHDGTRLGAKILYVVLGHLLDITGIPSARLASSRGWI